MPVPDSLERLARELDGMAPRARNAILRSLTPEERDMFAKRAGETNGSPDAVIEPMDRFSPWLAVLIEQARSDVGNRPDRLTSASRQALLNSVDAIAGRPSEAAKDQGVPGRSLFDAMGGLFAPRRARP